MHYISKSLTQPLEYHESICPCCFVIKCTAAETTKPLVPALKTAYVLMLNDCFWKDYSPVHTALVALRFSPLRTVYLLPYLSLNWD